MIAITTSNSMRVNPRHPRPCTTHIIGHTPLKSFVIHKVVAIIIAPVKVHREDGDTIAKRGKKARAQKWLGQGSDAMGAGELEGGQPIILPILLKRFIPIPSMRKLP